MPRIRLLADLAIATPGTMGADDDLNPVYNVPPGELVPVVLDATGWAGADSVTGSDWAADNGLTLSSRTLSGTTAKCNAYVPEQLWRERPYRLQNTLTLDTGVTRKTTLWLRARGY